MKNTERKTNSMYKTTSFEPKIDKTNITNKNFRLLKLGLEIEEMNMHKKEPVKLRSSADLKSRDKYNTDFLKNKNDILFSYKIP